MAEWRRASGDARDEAEYHEAAFLRAESKLRDLLAGRGAPQPVGWIVGPIVVSVVFLVVPGLAAVYGALRALERTPGVTIILGALGLFALLLAASIISGCRIDSPKRLLKLFFKAVGHGRLKRARRLVVPGDLDDFERLNPELPPLGPYARPPYVFGNPRDFDRYWKELLRFQTSPYCVLRFSRFKLERVSDTIVVATFDLKLMINSSLWMLLIFLGPPGILIAAIADAVTRKTVTAQLRKILVRHGKEWFLFNGEWQGPEEEFSEWLYEEISAR